MDSIHEEEGEGGVKPDQHHSMHSTPPTSLHSLTRQSAQASPPGSVYSLPRHSAQSPYFPDRSGHKESTREKIMNMLN